MSILQLIPTPVNPSEPISGNMNVMEVFRTVGYEGNGWYMRVDPVGFLTNSKTVQESLARGKILVVNMATGTVHIIKGDIPVERAGSAKLTVSE